MGAYTQFSGKPMANLFGMANQGGGIADIISNQMGTNEQIQAKAVALDDPSDRDWETEKKSTH